MKLKTTLEKLGWVHDYGTPPEGDTVGLDVANGTPGEGVALDQGADGFFARS